MQAYNACFTINNTFELTLKKPTTDTGAAAIGFKANSDAVADNVQTLVDAYNQMMADAMENKFDVIIFHKIDRNSRNELNYFIFKDKLEKLGIRYEYAAQPIDTDSPEGQVMETVMVGMAAYYSRNLAKETKKGMNENAYKAIFYGGYAPLGYKIVDKHYVIDEKEAEAVRLIFNLYLDGKGYGEICLALAARGYTTRSGKNFPKNSLHDILLTERYM